jgi:hypothetical protein
LIVHFEKATRFSILVHRKEINTDNQALLVDAWFLRGGPREKQEVKTFMPLEIQSIEVEVIQRSVRKISSG